jgi:predicted CXXCH cytochrome family protein
LIPNRFQGLQLRKRLAAVVVLMILISCVAAEAAITFIYPAPKSWVKRSDYLIFKLNNPEITGVKITVNGLASEMMLIGSPEYRKAFQDLLILQAVWDPGKNDVIVEGYNGDKKLETVSTDIFYNVKRDAAVVPGEYRINVVHVPEVEKLCSPCHTMTPTAAQLDGSQEKKNPCYVCHKKMANLNYVHGPTGTFSCAYCHSLQGKPKYAIVRQGAALCNDCHAEKAAELKKRKLLHGPVEAGLCEVCHDSHGSDYPSQLHQPVNELCLSCHENIRTDTHVVRMASGKGHPLSGVPDPSRPGSGRELSCVSCHNPHGGDVRFFFQNNLEDRMQLCQGCHNK